MLTGIAEVERLAAGAPRMESFRSEPLVLEGVEILQVAFEAESHGIEAALPPALHPTIPPLVTWLVWRCRSGPFGSFTLAQTRISCRSGVRPRGYLVAAMIDGDEAARRLAAEWGYRCEAATVGLQRGYDRITAVVSRGGQPILDVSLLDPDPLAPDDVQYT
ncbi:MAG: acetoacetate decarboxylase family protein, partial [Candidatus Binatia bacterium]